MRFEIILMASLAISCDDRGEYESEPDPPWATVTGMATGVALGEEGSGVAATPQESSSDGASLAEESGDGDGAGDDEGPQFDLGTGGAAGDGDGDGENDEESSSSDSGATVCTDASMSLMVGCGAIAQYEHYRYCTECTDDPCTFVECTEECREDYEDAIAACWGKYPLCGELADSSIDHCAVECGETMTACIYDVQCQGGTDTVPCVERYTECMEEC